MFGLAKKNTLDEKDSGSTLYDLTHLEINTIIKEEMTASKANSSPRLLLNDIATTYDRELISLGEKYATILSPEVVMESRNAHPLPPEGKRGNKKSVHEVPGYETLFRGIRHFEGSGYHSFRELSNKARTAFYLLKEQKDSITGPAAHDVNSDMMMLTRIQAISDNIRNILTKSGDVPSDGETEPTDFDDPQVVRNFMYLPAKEAQKQELKLDLRQLMVIKKANDIGTEKVLMQTIIGMDGDITTRISRAFANQPVPFINDLHKDAINISVDYWKTLITIVVDLGKSIAKFLNNA